MKGVLQSLPGVGRAFMDITPDEVVRFWRFMQERFSTVTVNKRDAIEMQLVAETLAVLGIQGRDAFLRRYATTIGRRVYTPFDIGVPRGGWALWSQVVVCAHEHQHVVQHDREGARFEFSYLAIRSERARWEAEALRSNLELQFWRTGRTPPVLPLAEGLRAYGCRDEDVHLAERALALSAVSVRQGGVINEASHAALDWLDTNVPRLRASGLPARTTVAVSPETSDEGND